MGTKVSTWQTAHRFKPNTCRQKSVETNGCCAENSLQKPKLLWSLFRITEPRNIQKQLIRLPNLPTDWCRRCHSSSKTILHITFSCKSFVQIDNKYRPDQLEAIHQNRTHYYSFIYYININQVQFLKIMHLEYIGIGQ